MYTGRSIYRNKCNIYIYMFPYTDSYIYMFLCIQICIHILVYVFKVNALCEMNKGEWLLPYKYTFTANRQLFDLLDSCDMNVMSLSSVDPHFSNACRGCVRTCSNSVL